MPSLSPDKSGLVLTVGSTGNLGGLVLNRLIEMGKPVRALVRPGSDISKLPAGRVEIVRGDLLDRSSLDSALDGVSVIVTSAIGYSNRKEGDSLRTDTEGNSYLVDAAKKAGVSRFVFLSILSCNMAPEVPHFWAKKVTEDRLIDQKVPFVSLRPGAFIGMPWMRSAIESGMVMSPTPEGVRMTYLPAREVARVMALAVDEPRALGRRIDLGCDRPVSGPELAMIVGKLLGREIKYSPMRSYGNADMDAMVRFFQTGKYVADTTLQAKLFGPVPKIDDVVRQMLIEFGLLPA